MTMLIDWSIACLLEPMQKHVLQGHANCKDMQLVKQLQIFCWVKPVYGSSFAPCRIFVTTIFYIHLGVLPMQKFFARSLKIQTCLAPIGIEKFHTLLPCRLLTCTCPTDPLNPLPPHLHTGCLKTTKTTCNLISAIGNSFLNQT